MILLIIICTHITISVVHFPDRVHWYIYIKKNWNVLLI